MREPEKKKRKKIHCKLCKKMLAYVGNTMSMWNHLEDCHVEEYRSLKCETDGSKTNEKRQPTLKQSLAGSQPLLRSSDRWKKS